MQPQLDQVRTNNSLSLGQIIMQPQINLTHIENNHYFILVNKRYNQALSYRQSNKYSQQHAILLAINENDIQQVFQIQQIQTQKYEIVHGYSTLVFTQDDQQVMLRFGNWKSNQFWYPQQLETSKHKLQYWIKTSKNSNKYLYYDGFALRTGSIDSNPQACVWEIRLCRHNKQLNKSCWIQNAFSNQVIDVPGATQKPDTELIQYPCNYRFNQRFYIEVQQLKTTNGEQLFTIQNLKTTQFLTVIQSPFSTSVVQTFRMPKPSLHQFWRIQYIGVGLYKIRSSLRENMYLVVKDRSAKSEEPLAISENQSWCLWKITGNFNIMPNKDYKF